MAATAPTPVYSNANYGIGTALETFTVPLDNAATSNIVTPTYITKIVRHGVTNKANSNAFKTVKSFSSSAGRDILTITGTTADSFDVAIEGTPA